MRDVMPRLGGERNNDPILRIANVNGLAGSENPG